MELFLNLDVLNMFMGMFPITLLLGAVLGLIDHALQNVVQGII